MGYREWLSDPDMAKLERDFERLRAERDELAAVIERVAAERDAYRRDFEAELAGNVELRRKYGAREHETMFAFIARLAEASAVIERVRDVLVYVKTERDKHWAVEHSASHEAIGDALEEVWCKLDIALPEKREGG